jgi:hypothetical protein
VAEAAREGIALALQRARPAAEASTARASSSPSATRPATAASRHASTRSCGSTSSGRASPSPATSTQSSLSFDGPGELVGIDVVDYKTYAKESPEAKDWRQGVFYDVAVRDLDQARGALACSPRVAEIMGRREGLARFRSASPSTTRASAPAPLQDGRRRPLAAPRRAGHVPRRRENGVFLPAEKGRNPDFCDYPENCCLRNRGAAAPSPSKPEVPLAT